MDRLILWLHLLSLAAYFGTTLTLVLVVLPLAERQPAHPDRLSILATALARVNPIVIAVLGVLVMTGAFGLTRYKADLGGAYFARVGQPLVSKLLLTFFLINGATYLTFGLAHRIVRAVEWGDSMPPEKLAGMIRRMRVCAYVNLVLTAWITWVALTLPGATTRP